MFPGGLPDAYVVTMPKTVIHRLRIDRKSRRPRAARWDVLPLDPRDPEVVRAKVPRKRG